MRRIYAVVTAIVGMALGGLGLLPDLAASASVVPAWGPLRPSSPASRILTDVSSTSVTFTAVGTPKKEGLMWSERIRVPSASTTIRRSFVATGKSSLFSSGKPVALARVTMRVQLTLLDRGYTEKIFSSNFDRYWNVCVDEGKDVTAEGGDVYCTVWHPERVRMTTRSVIKNFPRPIVLSETDNGPVAPDCTPGDTKSEYPLTWKQDIYACHDSQEDRRADEAIYLRSVTVTAKVWNGKRLVQSTITGNVPSKGPSWIKTQTLDRCMNVDASPISYFDQGSEKTTTSGTAIVVSTCQQGTYSGSWVETSRTPYPAPTVSVSSYTQITTWTWRVIGTVNCSYVGRACPNQIWTKRTDGTWGSSSFDYELISAVPTGPFVGHPFDVTVFLFSGNPTGEFAYSGKMPTS